MALPKVTFNKHFFIIVACVVIVFAAGVISNEAWNNHVVKQRVATLQKQAIDADKKRRQANVVATEKAKLRAECNKEVAYYNTLTPVQKKNQPAPGCTALLAN